MNIHRGEIQTIAMEKNKKTKKTITMIETLPGVVKIKILEYLCDSGCWLRYKLFRTDVCNWLKAQPGLYVELKSLSIWQDKFKSEAYEYYFEEQMVLLRGSYGLYADDHVNHLDEFVVPYVD